MNTNKGRHNEAEYSLLFFWATLYLKDKRVVYTVQYTRMDTRTFDQLVVRLNPEIQRRHINSRDSLTAEEQVVICLRFLSTGDSYRTFAFNFRIGFSTVHYAVVRVCDAICKVLHEEQLPLPTTEMWLANANKFELLWNFPHCVGAIDGKHIVMQAPPNAGSTFYNYKGNFSIVLLAVVDAEYRFTAVDIGQYGSSSDSGVFHHSALGEALHENKLPCQKVLTLPMHPNQGHYHISL